jgi:dTDP-4-dehydrorhamnose reductase
MKVLVVGHRGMLAQALIRCLQHAGLTALSQGRPGLDITQAESIQKALAALQPDLVINAAAYTSVDQAESETAQAFAVNRDGAAHVADGCQEIGIPLIHVSTDYVFDGTGRRSYREEDRPAPLGVYGESKWQGEVAVRVRLREHLIVRTAWVYSRHGHNFLQTMLRLARERTVLRVVDDQYGCPTWSWDLATALVTMGQRIVQDRDRVPWGTYHYCGAGQTTWYGFAQAIIKAAQAFEPLKVREIVPIPTTAYPTPAQRPANSVLDCAKVRTVFGIAPRPWQESVQECIQEIYTRTPTPPQCLNHGRS